MTRVGQNRISAPYIAVCMVISLLKIPYVHRTYTYNCMVLANFTCDMYIYGSGQPYTYTSGQLYACLRNAEMSAGNSKPLVPLTHLGLKFGGKINGVDTRIGSKVDSTLKVQQVLWN